jgi:uncharacterized protein
VLAIGVLLVLGQLLQLSSFPTLSGAERGWLVCSILCYSGVLVGLAAVAGGLASRQNTGLLAALLWTILLGSSSVYLIDHFSYNWLSLHLNETVPLLVQNVRTDFQVMGSKKLLLILAICAYGAFVVAGTFLVWEGMKRTAWCARPVSLRATLLFTAISMALLAADRVVAPHVLSATTYQAKNDVLWQVNVYTPRHPLQRQPILDIESPKFRQLPDESTIDAALASLNPASATHPYNIFLFVIESLREDAIAEDATPTLFQLKGQALPVERGLAAGNVTHISWFSLLHGVNPMYWSVEAHQSHSRGAVPIRVLRKLGYRIGAIGSPSLRYYGFSQSVFGDNEALATTLMDQGTFFDAATDKSAADIDEKAMAALGRELDNVGPDGRVFYVTMLDATHHDYSWSSRYHPKFLPFSESVSLLSTVPSDINSLRNRYRNAVNFTDMLLGEFLRKLAARGLANRSIVIVTGDHGEEFLERGHLVHSSELNRFQTLVPILIAMPQEAGADAPAPESPIRRASHLDIFPTVFDALGVKRQTERLLDGRSLLVATPPDRILFCAMASSYTPSRLLLDGGPYKLIVELEGSGKVGRTLYARRLYASRVLNGNDDEVAVDGPTVEQIRTRFWPGIRGLLADR